MTPEDITFIVQGSISRPPHHSTLDCISSIRKHFPGAEIIISTWEGESLDKLDADHILLLDDPGVVGQQNNVNRLLIGVREGIKAATRNYICKIRSDIIFTSANLIKYYTQEWPQRQPDWIAFSERIIIPSFFTRKATPYSPYPFHPSDWAAFGEKNDIAVLFSQEKAEYTDIHSMFYPSVLYQELGTWQMSVTPEQYILRGLLSSTFGAKKDVSIFPLSVSNIENSNRFIAANFIVLDTEEQFGISNRKYPKSDINPRSIMVHKDWLSLARSYTPGKACSTPTTKIISSLSDNLNEGFDQSLIESARVHGLEWLATLNESTHTIKLGFNDATLGGMNRHVRSANNQLLRKITTNYANEISSHAIKNNINQHSISSHDQIEIGCTSYPKDRYAKLKKSKPLLFIAIPIFNAEKNLSRCLESILNQIDVNLMVAIIDSDSTDNSSKIAMKFADMDERVVYFHFNCNIGRTHNWNRAINFICSPFFKLMMVNDQLAPTACKNALDAFANDCTVSLVSVRNQVILQGEPQESEIKKFNDFILDPNETVIKCMLNGNTPGGPSSQFFRTLVGEIPRFDYRFDWAADFDFSLRYIELARDNEGKGKFRHIDEALCIFDAGTERNFNSTLFAKKYVEECNIRIAYILERAREISVALLEKIATSNDLLFDYCWRAAINETDRIILDKSRLAWLDTFTFILGLAKKNYSPAAISTHYSLKLLSWQELSHQSLLISKSEPTNSTINYNSNEDPQIFREHNQIEELDHAELKPPSQNSNVNYYDIWLDLHRKSALPLSIYEKSMLYWGIYPKVTITTFAVEKQHAEIRDTCFALLAQIYPHWNLDIISFSPPPADLPSDSRISWQTLSDDDDSLEATNIILTKTNSDWVGRIYPGDRLAPEALYLLANMSRRNPELQWLYSDEDTLTIKIERNSPLLKPDFDADLLRSSNYIGGLSLYSRALFASLGGFDAEFEGCEDFDFALRASARLAPKHIGHIAEILYHRFENGRLSYHTPDEEQNLAQQALNRHLHSLGWQAEVNSFEGRYFSIDYRTNNTPIVDIIIPTRDGLADLKRCIDSLVSLTRYPNYKIHIIDNQSQQQEILAYFEDLKQRGMADIILYDAPFNFSAMHNEAIAQLDGEYVLLLNDDTQVLDPEWLDKMLGIAEETDAGVVGPMLVFENGKIQHAGIVLGIDHMPAEHVFIDTRPEDTQLMNRNKLLQQYSAVTGACMLLRRADYLAVGGMDAEVLTLTLQDVDLCLKIRQQLGKRIIWTPSTRLLHDGSKTTHKLARRQPAAATKARNERIELERNVFFTRWREVISNDPAYNPNLTLASRTAALETDPALTGHRCFRPAPLALACPADHFGCGEYRVKAPMRALMRQGMLDGSITERLYGPSEIMRINPDSVIFQRQLEDHQLAAMQRYRDRTDAFIIYELDDLITESWHPDFTKSDALERTDKLKKALSIADRLIASTPLIAESYAEWAKETVIVPNFMPLDRWGMLRPARRLGKKPRVGWAGGSTHGPDLAMIADVVKILHNEVEWVFLGTVPEAMRPYVHEYHQGVHISGYPAALAYLELDLALAPLTDNRFNRSRTSLRILEFGILGYPVIASDLPSYRGFPIVNVGASVDDWVNAIREHIADRDELARRGDNLRQHIMENWILEKNLDVWRQAWLRG
ncbi:WavE lipopolysaccharide synthesis family protein [Chitinilyticum litopenaei]|uniref:WavE lipopolysaccharide synthesis family protein n=1 Tax=Chitinilyticum litopenaei TaxID=1121276 RepID=UPI0003F79B4B|nr:WavE lipopolysaccharide synthesis family protein [Chitinilyticum litopenaei]